MSKNSLLLAASVAAVGIVIALLVSIGWALGWWLLAGFLVCHGCVHLLFVVPGSAEEAAAGKRIGLTKGETRSIGLSLEAVSAIGFLFAALATLVGSAFWGLLIVVSCLASLALIAFFWSRQFIVGAAIDAILLVVVFAGLWHP
jgi:hypothetical protein